MEPRGASWILPIHNTSKSSYKHFLRTDKRHNNSMEHRLSTVRKQSRTLQKTYYQSTDQILNTVITQTLNHRPGGERLALCAPASSGPLCEPHPAFDA